jgi:nitrogenase molybdenum-iron protein alpha chain
MPLTLLNSDKAIPEREKHTYIKAPSEDILPLSNVPIKDVIHLVHGPIGCAYWTWGGGTRQNLSDNPGFHGKYCFSTDMQEDNIIFGGEDKLYKSILEAHEEFPEARGVFVHSTCAIGLGLFHSTARGLEAAANRLGIT